MSLFYPPTLVGGYCAFPRVGSFLSVHSLLLWSYSFPYFSQYSLFRLKQTLYLEHLFLSWGYIFYFHLFLRHFKLDLTSSSETSFYLQIVSLLIAITYSFHQPSFTPCYLSTLNQSSNSINFFMLLIFFHFYITLLSSNLSFFKLSLLSLNIYSSSTKFYYGSVGNRKIEKTVNLSIHSL